MRNIKQALQEHYDAVAAHYPEKQILGVFIYGSQNYNTATEDSDVDTKAIIIPTFADLVFKKPVSVQLNLPNNEHCEVKDIREMVDMFKKQNTNFVEILYTDYFILNPFYEELWNKYFIANREDIAHYDMNKTLQSICGQAIHTLKQNPFDGKKVSNGYRLYYFLSDYLNGKSYVECIQQKDKYLETILKYKYYKTLNYDTQALDLIDAFEQIKELKVANHPYNQAETAMFVGAEKLIRLLDDATRNKNNI